GAALFVLLALLPISLFAGWGAGWLPPENLMGTAGAVLRTLLLYVFGVSAFLTPALIGVVGLSVGGWLERDTALRVSLLLVGVLVLAPMLLWIFGAAEAAGWLGVELGAPLSDLLGRLGALLAAGVALVALCVVTLGWNPLRGLADGVRAGGDVAVGTARALAERGRGLTRTKPKKRGRAKRRKKAAEEADVEAAPLPGLAPEWLEGVDDPDAEPVEEPSPAGAGEEAGEGGEAWVPPWEEPAVATAAVPDASFAAEEADLAEGEETAGEDEGAPAHEDELPDPSDPSVMSAFEREMPPVDLLSAPEQMDRESMDRQLDELGRILVEKLRTFNVECELGGRTTGPVVTQFEVIPAPGVKVNRIANLDADLALAMRAHAIRIVAPIPGKGAVGVEIPNPRPEIVNLREILETPAFRSAKAELPLALGKDLTGRPYVAALEAMPHLLIAGATGSGKSVCLNTLVTSLVYRHTPETLRLLMIDPKMVELSVYSRLPHLRHNVVTDPRDAAGVLKWAVLEMGRRYELLKANHVRSIQEFNRKVRAGKTLKRVEPKGPEGDENRWIYADGVLPYIVVVVDELADLMMTVQAEVEKPLTQLAQKARAIGIHLIVATQRPSVNVITGLIKANFPTRIAFRVASKTDSRTILDQNGADALLGNGDMLFLPPGRSDPVRIQGAYLPTEDTERLMNWYIELLERRPSAAPEGEREVLETDILEELRDQEEEAAEAAAEEISGDWDELFRQAAEICIQNGGGSTSLLQRRLSIGYGRAARIVDQLEEAGVLGPSEGAKGREVLMGLDDLDLLLGKAGASRGAG
ncbi:MAG TPA: DNA translocase FtsK 4TM domain-containing protein, partial [Longimicrobiales bacterium]|nr:DNA translocase FtsK 4TM domain-containing protein [Longimicrobiales bacterium]